MFLLMLKESFLRGRRRKALAVVTVFFAAGLITALMNISIDVGDKMAQELKSYGANISVVPKSENIMLEIGGIDYNPLKGRVFLEEKDLPGIKDIFWQNNIIGFAPYLKIAAEIDGAEKQNVQVTGTYFNKHLPVADDNDFHTGVKTINPFWQVEGSWISVNFDEKHCMIGKALAKKMELKAGDSVNIVNRDTGFQKAVLVKGIMETGQAEDEQMFVNLSLARKILAIDGGVHHAMLNIVNERMDVDDFAADIETKYQGIDAKPLRKVSHSEGRILEKIKGLMAFVAFIILTITTLCVMTTLMAMVVERTREIGLMKALGAGNGSIVLQFLAETGVIGLAGVIAGLAAGFVLAQILGQAIFNSYISFRPAVLPLTLAISLAAALTASVLPVKRAVSIIPAKVLKEE